MYRIRKLTGFHSEKVQTSVRPEEAQLALQILEKVQGPSRRASDTFTRPSRRPLNFLKNLKCELGLLRANGGLAYFIVIVCLSTTTSHALDSDRKEKLNIIADSGQYNFKTGVDVYEGHVRIDQGTTHVTAEKLITKKNRQHKIVEAIAYGEKELAHYWTLQKPGDPDMHARAKIIKFYPLQMNVTLEKNVHVTQGENDFQGELVHYNSKEQLITMPASTNGRAMLVYNPDK